MAWRTSGTARRRREAIRVPQPSSSRWSDNENRIRVTRSPWRTSWFGSRCSSAGGAEGPNVRRARGLIESLPADVRASRRAGDIEGALWSHIAARQVAAKDYAAARISYGNQMRAAEAVWRLNPKDNDASRNLSLACKQLGAVLQVQQARTEARALFEKALALDRERVERDPARGLWRLDLSFSLGSIGALLQGQGDLDGAIAHYEQAVELRRAVVAAEPADEFARVSLARGYQRLALIETARGRTAEALELASSPRRAVPGGAECPSRT